MGAPYLPIGSRQVLHRAWRRPFTTKSDYARTHANVIAALATAGLLTSATLEPDAPWGSCWHATAAGIRNLERTAS